MVPAAAALGKFWTHLRVMRANTECQHERRSCSANIALVLKCISLDFQWSAQRFTDTAFDLQGVL